MSISNQLVFSEFGTHPEISKSLAYLLKALLPNFKVNSYLSCPVKPIKAVNTIYPLSLTKFFEYSFAKVGSKTPSHQKCLTFLLVEFVNAFDIHTQETHKIHYPT